MELTTWVVGWVAVTACAVALGYLRMTISMHDVLGMRIDEPDTASFYEQQQATARKLKKIDLFGISATVLSAALALVIVVVWAIEHAGGR
jgi:hypothetical protein